MSRDTATAARTAALVTHSAPSDSRAVEAALKVAERLSCELIASPEEAKKHGERGSGLRIQDDGATPPDICLVLGGDGTILAALREFAGTGVPVFAVNFGRIGFLAAVEAAELESGLERALRGEFEIVELPALEVEHEGKRWIGVNDVTFTRRPQGPVAELAYRLGGEEVGHVRCDGLVAATPAGSTGYNLANHGPILAWGVEGYAVSFIAPHTLTARALVVAPDDVLHVRNEASRDEVQVEFDGNHELDLAVGHELEVQFRDNVARLAQLPGTTFYHRFREKFGLLAR